MKERCVVMLHVNLRLNTIGFNISVTVMYTAVNVKIVENICFSIHNFLSEYCMKRTSFDL